MTQGERVKKLRKELVVTLEKFGARIGVGKSTISDIENNRRTLTEHMAKSICREFGVEYKWLTTGKGEMFLESDDEFMAKIDRIMAGEDEDRKNLFKLMLELDDADISALHSLMKKAIDFSKKCSDSSKKKETFVSPPSTILNAAHDNGATDEQKQAADNIMMDDSEWE